MAQRELIQAANRLAGKVFTTDPVDVAGLYEYTFQLDSAAWGNHDAKSPARNTYEWWVEELRDGQFVKSHQASVGCVGGRAKNGALPTMTVAVPTDHYRDDDIGAVVNVSNPWPPGTTLRLHVQPSVPVSLGVKGSR